jgi:cellobiose phosphorylase
VLGERVPFLEAPHLAADVHESYRQPRISSETATLFSHCVRAIDKGTTVGAHGLPLIGGGGLNDGMNRVGAGGRGESTWLGFFLHAVLTEFEPLCRGTGLYKTEPCVMAADVYVWARTRAASWTEYSIQWTFLDTRYDITVSNPTGRSRGVGMRCWTAPRPMQQRFR